MNLRELSPVQAFEVMLGVACGKKGVMEWRKEVRFHPTRDFRFDYYHPGWKLAVEIDGGVHSGGRHVRPVGFLRDLEKVNEAQKMGIIVLRYGNHNQIAGFPQDYEAVTALRSKTVPLLGPIEIDAEPGRKV